MLFNNNNNNRIYVECVRCTRIVRLAKRYAKSMCPMRNKSLIGSVALILYFFFFVVVLFNSFPKTCFANVREQRIKRRKKKTAQNNRNEEKYVTFNWYDVQFGSAWMYKLKYGVLVVFFSVRMQKNRLCAQIRIILRTTKCK